MRNLLVLLVISCLPMASDRLEDLAKRGQIDLRATVVDGDEVLIHAPPERVWSLLSDISAWPSWQPDVKKTEVHGPLAAGTKFSWTAGGTTINSEIALVKPMEQLFWTGTAYKARAIHGWTLTRVFADQTRVQTTESMSGFGLRLFYSAKDLHAYHERWLSLLKIAAER